MKKWYTLVAMLVIVAALTFTVSASTGTVQKSLSYNDIKITLDGQEITPLDANGNYVEPFIIDGTTYLPVRGISSALGLGVGWDQSTHTVQLTSQELAPIPDQTPVPAYTPKTIAENEYVTVSFEKLYEEEYVQGAAYLTLAITSKIDQEIWVYLENASVNDEQLPMVGSGVSMYIKPMKTSRNPFILSYKTLTIESVAEIKALEFDVVVADKESLNEISRISGVKVVP